MTMRISIIVAFCSIIFVPANYAWPHVRGEPVKKRYERESVVMGLDYHLHLFNLKTYKERALPAYRRFFEKDDPEPLIALLNEVIEKLGTNSKLPGPTLWSEETYKEEIGILDGSVYYNHKGDYSSHQGERKTTRAAKRLFAKNSVGPDVVLALCVPRDKGVNPEQNMGRTRLMPYLYDRSEWIEDLFTGSRKVSGGHLEILISESPSQLFTKEDIRELSAELTKVPPPEDPELRKEYYDLQTLLRLALEDPDLTLLLSLL